MYFSFVLFFNTCWLLRISSLLIAEGAFLYSFFPLTSYTFYMFSLTSLSCWNLPLSHFSFLFYDLSSFSATSSSILRRCTLSFIADQLPTPSSPTNRNHPLFHSSMVPTFMVLILVCLSSFVSGAMRKAIMKQFSRIDVAHWQPYWNLLKTTSLTITHWQL